MKERETVGKAERVLGKRTESGSNERSKINKSSKTRKVHNVKSIKYLCHPTPLCLSLSLNHNHLCGNGSKEKLINLTSNI